jgi:VanZ family protein
VITFAAMVWLRRAAWVLTAGYWVGIFTLTHLPPEQIARAPRVWDKLAHFVIYFLLAVLLGTALMLSFPRRRRIPVWVLGIGFVYGAVDELVQPFVRREATLLDWVADALGVWVAVLLLWALRKFVLRDLLRALPTCNTSSSPTTSQA